MLMFLSLSAPYALNKVDWSTIYDVWKQMKLESRDDFKDGNLF
jgi:hypothetical protein